MDIRQLEYIISLADHPNMTDAAAALGISQSTLSRSVAEISKQIGIPLFSRGKSLQLTPAGRKYVEGARKIIAVRNQTYQLIHSATDRDQEYINIGLAPHVDSSIMVEIYDQFQRQFPQVQLIITEGYSMEIAELVKRRVLDISVGIQSEELIYKYGLHFIPTQKLEHLIAIAETNSLSEGGAYTGYDPDIPTMPISRLQDIPFIAPHKNAISYYISSDIFSGSGITPLTVCTTNNTSISKKMACAYNGYTFLPMDSCDADCGLRYFFMDPHMVVQKGFYLRKDLQETPALQYLMDLYTRQMILRSPLSAGLYAFEKKEVPDHV